MRSYQQTLIGLAECALPWVLTAQSTPPPPSPLELCAKPLIKVAAPDRIVLRCGKSPGDLRGIRVTVTDPKTSERIPGLGHSVQDQFILVELSATLRPGVSYSLEAGRAGDSSGLLTTDFSTKAEAKLEAADDATVVGRQFVAESSVAFAQDDVTENETLRIVVRKKAYDPNKERDVDAANDSREVRAIMQRDYHGAGSADPDFGNVGRVSYDVSSGQDRIRGAKASLEAKTRKNIFNEDVKIAGDVDLAGAPESKDKAQYYLKLGAQFADASKPTFSADVSLAPVVSIWKGFEVKPTVLLDIAQNSKTAANTMKFGLALAKGWSTPTLSLGGALETDRDFTAANVIQEGEVAIYSWTLNQPVDTRNRTLYSKARKQRPAIRQEEVVKAHVGWGLAPLLGWEAGGALLARDVSNSKKTTTLTVPRYAIVRFRPGVTAFLELDRLKFENKTYLRFLGHGENVAEELPDATKSMRLRVVRGFRGYSDTSIGYSIDPAKHVAIAVSFKYGQAPPLFTHVRAVVTGLTFIY
jgi:hypothetical protein